MTYHLGTEALASAPAADTASTSRTYGYWKISDPGTFERLRAMGLPNFRGAGMGRVEGLEKLMEERLPLVFLSLTTHSNLPAQTNVKIKYILRLRDGSWQDTTEDFLAFEEENNQARRFLAKLENLGTSVIPTMNEIGVNGALRSRLNSEERSARGASSGAMSYNTRIALGIGAGALLLLVGLGVTLGGRKRAGMQPNRKRTSRSRGMRPNDRRWEMQQYYQSQHGAERRRASQRQAREDAALRMWRELTLPVIDSRGAVHMPSPDDRMAAIELVRQAYPDVDLWWLPRVEPNRSVFPNSRWKSSPGKHKYHNRTAIQDYFLRTATDAGKARLEIAESERENRPADLSHARLRSIDLSGAYLVAADLRGTDLSHADLSGANLSYANLEGANLRSADLTGAMLKEANLTRANLKDAELVNADLTNADLTDAYLYGADTTGAVMQPNRSAVYAIPERKAYPITTSMDAYHATQRLKQGRVKSEDEARRIVAAIKREHHDIWTKYLKDYPVSRIMTSKRKGLAARRRA